jgi:hypothetical protein
MFDTARHRSHTASTPVRQHDNDTISPVPLTLLSFILKPSGTNGLRDTIVAPSFRSRNMLVRSALRLGGKTSLLTSCGGSVSARLGPKGVSETRTKGCGDDAMTR